MAYDFQFPDVGEGITEGEIVEWKVAVGQRVEAHETLVLIETDKAVVEIPAPVAGVLLRQGGDAGDMIQVGAVLAVIGAAAVSESTAPAAIPEEEVAAPIPIPGGRLRVETAPATPVVRGSVGVVGELEEAPEEDPQEVAIADHRGTTPLSETRAKVLPRDRLLARKLGVDVDLLRGTGPAGRVTDTDIRRHAERGPAQPLGSRQGAPGTDRYGPVERVPVRGVRRKIAESMVRSLATAAQVTTTDEARVDLLWHIRGKEKDSVAARGAKLTLLPFVIKAVVSALRREPHFNAVFDQDAGEMVLKGYYNIGVAVETPDGLIVPNVKEADRKSVVEIARELQDLTVRARQRTLDLDCLRGGTFTVSNYGSLGGIFATPILNPPEVGILGLGRVLDKPAALDGAIKIAKVLPLSLTFDHRAVDGATAQHFLNGVRGNLEDPDRFLVGM